MPLKELNLIYCMKLTGKSACALGVEQQSVASGQHLDLGHVLRGARVLTPLSLHLALPGDIAALKDMPLTTLSLWMCENLTGKSAM